jgi:hypothetical protein
MTADRTPGRLPDQLAATAAAATALRCLARFHECMTVVTLHDTAGLLAWTASVPSKAEIGGSYEMLIESLTGSTIDTAAGQVAVLALVENIVVDEANERIAVSPGDLAAAARMLRNLRDLAHDSVIGELVGDAMLGRSREDQPEAGAALSTPARHPQSLLRLVERWRELDEQHGHAVGERRRALGDEIQWLENTIAATPARGDADLIAKGGMLRQIIEADLDLPQPVRALAASLLDDIERVIDGRPPC